MSTALLPYYGAGYTVGRHLGLKLRAAAGRYAARKIGMVARNYLRRRARKRGRMSYMVPSPRPIKRTRTRFSRKQIGFRVGEGTTKRRQIENTAGVLQNTRVLNSVEVTNIPEGNSINQRERQMANLRGFKMCLEVRNVRDEPLYFNLAVLAPKGATASVVTADFFRGSTDDRAQDFDATALNSNEFHCLPINSDKYVVLLHKRYRLGPSPGATLYTNENSNNFLNIDRYVSLKRQLRWSSGEQSAEVGRVYVVYWASVFNGASGAPPLLNAYSVSRRYVTYWKEPKN